MQYLKNANFSSHPSIRIIKKIIIFVTAIIIPNGTGKNYQYVLNNARHASYSVPASCYVKTEA